MEVKKSSKIAVGIVLYHPDMSRLEQCLRQLSAQAERIYIYDNGTVKADLTGYKQVICMTKPGNKGIAYALNRIVERAGEDGYKWVLTMDQDSVIPDGMIEDFEQYTGTDDKIAIICPQVIDRRRAYMHVQDSDSTQYIDMCITSASCTSVKAWDLVGRYDERLFIDLVDNDFCRRLTVSGYKIMRLNKWVLDQEFGEITPKAEKVQRFWVKLSRILHNQNVAKFSYRKEVHPQRVYYTNRNIIYVNRKLKKYGKTAYENYNCKGYPGFMIAFNLPSILRAKQKRKVFMAICRGIHDGRRMHVKPWAPADRGKIDGQ